MINQSSYGGHHHLHQATSALLNQAGFPNNAAHAAQAGLVRTLLPGGHPSVSLGLEVRKTHIRQNCRVINWGIQTFASSRKTTRHVLLKKEEEQKKSTQSQRKKGSPLKENTTLPAPKLFSKLESETTTYMYFLLGDVSFLEKRQRGKTNESSALLLLPIGCNDGSKDGHLDKLMFC